MLVCDRCKKGEGLETIQIKGKSYDLCNICLNKIITFLTVPERTFGDKLGELFKK